MLVESHEFDVIAIGAGPGGEGAAMLSRKSDRSVVVVDRQARAGGGCTHSDTIPSKVLGHAIQCLARLNRLR